MNLRPWLWGACAACWLPMGSVLGCDNPTGVETRNATHNVGLYELNPYTQLWYLVESRYEPGEMSPMPGDYVEYLGGPGGGGGGGELQSDKKRPQDSVQDCGSIPELETVTAIGHSIPGVGNMLARRISRMAGGGVVRMTSRVNIPSNLPAPMVCDDSPAQRTAREDYASSYVASSVGAWDCALNTGAGQLFEVPFTGASQPGTYRWVAGNENRCGGSLFMQEVTAPACN